MMKRLKKVMSLVLCLAVMLSVSVLTTTRFEAATVNDNFVYSAYSELRINAKAQINNGPYWYAGALVPVPDGNGALSFEAGQYSGAPNQGEIGTQTHNLVISNWVGVHVADEVVWDDRSLLLISNDTDWGAVKFVAPSSGTARIRFGPVLSYGNDNGIYRNKDMQLAVFKDSAVVLPASGTPASYTADSYDGYTWFKPEMALSALENGYMTVDNVQVGDEIVIAAKSNWAHIVFKDIIIEMPAPIEPTYSAYKELYTNYTAVTPNNNGPHWFAGTRVNDEFTATTNIGDDGSGNIREPNPPYDIIEYHPGLYSFYDGSWNSVRLNRTYDATGNLGNFHLVGNASTSPAVMFKMPADGTAKIRFGPNFDWGNNNWAHSNNLGFTIYKNDVKLLPSDAGSVTVTDGWTELVAALGGTTNGYLTIPDLEAGDEISFACTPTNWTQFTLKDIGIEIVKPEKYTPYCSNAYTELMNAYNTDADQGPHWFGGSIEDSGAFTYRSKLAPEGQDNVNAIDTKNNGIQLSKERAPSSEMLMKLMTNDGRKSGVMLKVPEAGNAVIELGMAKSFGMDSWAVSSNNVKFAIYKNDTKLFPLEGDYLEINNNWVDLSTALAGQPSNTPFYVPGLQAGDELRFIVWGGAGWSALSLKGLNVKLLDNPNSITLTNTSGYTISDGMIFGANHNTSVADFKNNFEALEYLKFPTVLATGAEVKLMADAVAVDTLSIVIPGDVTGEGLITSNDIISLKKHILEIDDPLTGAKLAAADVVKDSVVGVSDIIQAKKMIVDAIPNPISYIQIANDRETMYVDGQPFFYTGVQMSIHRMSAYGFYEWEDFKKVVKAAKDTGFTTIGAPIAWTWVEIGDGVYDFTSLDRMIEYCAEQGLKFEILWYGSDVCGDGDIPTFLRSGITPVLLENGTPVKGWDGTYKADKLDSFILMREKRVVRAMMDHTRKFIDENSLPNVVVGVQVLNEPKLVASSYETDSANRRSYSDLANAKWTSEGYTSINKFNADCLFDYANELSEEVKRSAYSVWTRVNMSGWAHELAMMPDLLANLEASRSTGGYLDFIGFDPYMGNVNQIYNIGTSGLDNVVWNTGNNLTMIMENHGGYDNSDRLIFNSYAADMRYHMFEICQSFPVAEIDSNYSGLYTTDWGTATITPKAHYASVKNILDMFNKDKWSLATKKASTGGTDAVFFNRAFSRNSGNIDQTVGGSTIRYNSTNNGGGIAIKRDANTYTFMSTAAATFSVPSTFTVTSLEAGYYNDSNVWVSEGTVSLGAASGGRRSFSIGAYQCIRLVGTFS